MMSASQTYPHLNDLAGQAMYLQTIRNKKEENTACHYREIISLALKENI